MSAESLSEPWRSFLLDLDGKLDGPTELYCFGGFVVAEYYGLTRPTADIDIIEATGATDLRTLAELAGKGSALAKQHVSTPVENLTVPPIENLTDRRGDEPQVVAASWRGRRRRAAGSGSCGA